MEQMSTEVHKHAWDERRDPDDAKVGVLTLTLRSLEKKRSSQYESFYTNERCLILQPPEW